MKSIFSVSFWVGAFMSAFITMVCIYCIKKANAKLGGVPIVSDIVEGV